MAARDATVVKANIQIDTERMVDLGHLPCRAHTIGLTLASGKEKRDFSREIPTILGTLEMFRHVFQVETINRRFSTKVSL